MKRSSSTSNVAVNLSPERLDTLTKLFVDDLHQVVSTGIHGWLRERLILFARLLMNAEVLANAGERYKRGQDRACERHGTQDGSILLLEQRVPVRKPRLRTPGGASEVEVETYALLNDKSFLNEQAAAKLLSGTSTRRFEKTLEKMLHARGVGRQTISQRAMSEMSARLEEFQTRSLANLDIVVVFIDGIHLGDTVYIAAVGIDSQGKRHVLDFEAGSTESSGIARKLLSNMLDRGILHEDGHYLFVIDGGTGVKKALGEVFGKRAHVQRCMVHKVRNVKEKLPKHMHEEFVHKFNAAYNQETLKGAESAFAKLRNHLLLQGKTAAANSLTEGLHQLLTLHRLGVRGTLRRSLYSTNCIESVFSAARYYTRNVKRWRKEEQMERWMAAGLLEAEKKLKRVPGYTKMKKLIAALKK